MDGRATRRGALVMGAAALLGISGCGSDAPRSSRMRFARLSGNVGITSGDAATANLIIVAPTRDPVWSGIHELVVVNDAPEGGDLVLAGDSAEIMPGTDKGGLRAGTLAVSIPSDVNDFDLRTVRVVVDEGGEPVPYDVGHWRMHRPESRATFESSGEYPASLPGGGEVVLGLRNTSAPEAQVTGIDTGAAGLTASDVRADFAESGEGTVTFTLEVDDSYDLFAFSPTLTVDEGGQTREEPLDPVLVGYLDLTEESVQRIASR